jgi:N-formylglutamate deformylase
MKHVYLIHGPEVPEIPLVFDSPHSGRLFPDDFGAAVSEHELREGEDAWIDELYAPAVSHGAPVLAAQFPRTYLDPNRHAGDVDLELIDGAWPHEHKPSGKGKLGKSLIWRTLDDARPIYSRKLAAAEVKQRIDRFHAPYHQALRGLLDAAHAKHGAVWHINCHSMKGVAGKQSDDGAGSVRADFVLGDRDGSTCEPGFTAFVKATLAGMGYSVKVNDPYKGVELVRAYSNPPDRRHSLQIEVNRRLYMDEKTYDRNAGYGRLEADLAKLISGLAIYVKEANRG